MGSKASVLDAMFLEEDNENETKWVYSKRGSAKNSKGQVVDLSIQRKLLCFEAQDPLVDVNLGSLDDQG